MDIVLQLDPSQADLQVVQRGLIAFNRAARGGAAAGYQPFGLHLKNDEGSVVGGLSGFAAHDWLFLELMFIEEAYRGRGHGTALLMRAEAFARSRGLAGIWVDTFEFQARGFYEKNGFILFGEIDNHPRGSKRFFLNKPLDPA